MEKYNKYLEPFNEFLLSPDPEIQELGWCMAFNSIKLKKLGIEDLQQLNIICQLDMKE